MSLFSEPEDITPTYSKRQQHKRREKLKDSQAKLKQFLNLILIQLLINASFLNSK
ncbi:hypothetical protein Sjap_024661 [Stephania japonica]|uniref:Uncharacterized protein n=1 Tax=Stephania japonica TaxID=461633 RepID=A0AAP0HLQ1_9MAGN